MRSGADMLPIILRAENSKTGDISRAGALGKYQIMPGTAQQYGFSDMDKLRNDDIYGEQVATVILNDLHRRFNGDINSILVGYNAGPGVATRWNANGKKNGLPLETMRYLNTAAKFIKINGMPALAPAPDAPPLPGAAEAAPMSEGQTALQKLQASKKFSSADIAAWKSSRSNDMLTAGKTPADIQAYWGEKDADPSHLTNAMAGNLAGQDYNPKIATNATEALAAGWDMSVAGLATGGLPKTVLGSDATTGQKVLAGVGGIADLPISIIGGLAAGFAASETGPGALVAGGAAAFALPTAMRETLMDYYKRGEVHTFSDFMGLVGHSTWETSKAAIAGAVGGWILGPAATVAEPFVGPIAGQGFALAASAVTATGVSAGLEGRVPDAGDAVAASVLMLGTAVGLHYVPGLGAKPTRAAQKVADNIETIYRQTGIAPWKLAEVAQHDPVILQEILAEDPHGNPVFPTLRLNAPDEPPPYAPKEVTIHEEPHVPEPEAPQIFTSTTKTPEAEAGKGAFKAISSTADGKAQNTAYGATAEEAAAVAKGVVEKLVSGGGGKKPPPPEEGVTPPTPEESRGRIEAKNGFGPHPIETLHEIAREFLGEPKEPASMLDLGKLYRQFVSELGPARAIDKLLATKGFDRNAQLGLEDMFRQTYASDARAGYFILKGAIDPITFEPVTRQNPQTGEQVPVEPMVKAFEAAKEDGGNFSDWVDYMVAKRALEKAAQGKKTGHPLTVPELERMVKLDFAKYDRATRIFQRAPDAVLEYGRLSGVFSQKQVDAMMRDNQTYISYRRLMGDKTGLPEGKGRSFKVGQPVRKFEGSDSQILDPVRATIDNIKQIIKMADRNRAIGSVIALAERHGMLEDLGLKRIPIPPEARIEIADPNSDVFKPYNVQKGEPYEPFLAQRAWRKIFVKDDNRFMYLRDGKVEFWQANDPTLAALIRGADTPAEATLPAKIVNGVARLQRAGIAGDPAFPTRVVLKHQVTAFILDRTSPPPFVMWIRGAMDAFGHGERFWDFVAKGGAGASLNDMDTTTLHNTLSDVFQETGTWSKLWNTVRHPLEAAEIVSMRIDMAARLGYVDNATRQGIEPIKATTMSRKAMIDHVERGTSQFMNGWSRATPFLRAHVLGLKQLGEAITERPGSVAIKAGLAIVLPKVILYGLNWMADQYLPEEQKYANLPRWQKDSMYILPPIGGVRMRLPLPFVVGPPVGGLTDRFLDHFLQNDPNAFKQWWSLLAAEFMPNIIPAIALPVLEEAANYNFFTGHPLIAERMKHASGEMQYTENTTKPAKALARLVGKLGGDLSPITVENYARALGGSLGIAALKAIDGVMTAGGGKPWELSDIPFVQSFVVRNPGTSAAPIEDFYSAREDFEKAAADKSLAIGRMIEGNPDAGDELKRALDEQTARVDGISRALAVERSLIIGTNNNETMTRDEKRQAIDTLYGNMIEIAKTGSAVFKEVKGE